MGNRKAVSMNKNTGQMVAEIHKKMDDKHYTMKCI
jgi:hypothetical protein